MGGIRQERTYTTMNRAEILDESDTTLTILIVLDDGRAFVVSAKKGSYVASIATSGEGAAPW